MPKSLKTPRTLVVQVKTHALLPCFFCEQELHQLDEPTLRETRAAIARDEHSVPAEVAEKLTI